MIFVICGPAQVQSIGTGVDQLLTLVYSHRLETRSNMEQLGFGVEHLQQSLGSQGVLVSETHSGVMRIENVLGRFTGQPESSSVDGVDVRAMMTATPRSIFINVQVPHLPQGGPSTSTDSLAD
jgi:hypothetical protein